MIVPVRFGSELNPLSYLTSIFSLCNTYTQCPFAATTAQALKTVCAQLLTPECLIASAKWAGLSAPTWIVPLVGEYSFLLTKGQNFLMKSAVYSKCPGRGGNQCTGHGWCNTTSGICTCSAGWRGMDCSIPDCPGYGRSPFLHHRHLCALMNLWQISRLQPSRRMRGEQPDGGCRVQMQCRMERSRLLAW